MGNCSYYVKGDWQTLSAQSLFFGSGRANQELQAFSGGFAYARKQAVMRLWTDIGMVGGDGAVDMDVDYKLERIEYEINKQRYIDMLINFMAMGTAVTERPDRKSRISPTPRMVIDLSGCGLNSVDFEDPLEDVGYSSDYSEDFSELDE